jgi:hypothetical protein
MTISLPPDIEAALIEQAHQQQTSPESLALETLRERLRAAGAQLKGPPQTHEEWLALVRNLGRDCGVSPPDQALSSESLYD